MTDFIVKKIYDNDEISGRIYCQLCNLYLDTILHEEKDRFFSHAFSVMHKLYATKYHLQNYKRIEKQQLQRAEDLFRKGKFELREQLELIFELEAFLFQIKSSLDMLAKLLSPIIGDNIVHTQTYKNKGEGLITGLERYKDRSGVNVVAVERLIELMRSDKDDWLSRVIDYRDTCSHFEAIRDYVFEPIKLPNGRIVAKKPSFKGMNTVEFMETAYSNNLEYHQDFIVFALAIKLPKTIVPIRQDFEKVKEEFGEAAKYVKWGLGFVKS